MGTIEQQSQGDCGQLLNKFQVQAAFKKKKNNNKK